MTLTVGEDTRVGWFVLEEATVCTWQRTGTAAFTFHVSARTSANALTERCQRERPWFVNFGTTMQNQSHACSRDGKHPIHSARFPLLVEERDLFEIEKKKFENSNFKERLISGLSLANLDVGYVRYPRHASEAVWRGTCDRGFYTHAVRETVGYIRESIYTYKVVCNPLPGGSIYFIMYF